MLCASSLHLACRLEKLEGRVVLIKVACSKLAFVLRNKTWTMHANRGTTLVAGDCEVHFPTVQQLASMALNSSWSGWD